MYTTEAASDVSYRLQRVAPASLPALPVALAEFKLYARIEHDDDTLIAQTCLRSAAAWLESATGLVFISAAYIAKFADWGLCLPVPRWPISAVTAVKYIDTDGATQTLASNQYQTDISTPPVLIVPARGVSWPSLRDGTINPVTVEFTAGYGATADDVPHIARQAICLLATHLYDKRGLAPATNSMPGGEIPMSIMRVIDPLIVSGIVA